MKIVLLSDTHGLHDDLVVPDGDLLLHAGDLTMRGELDEIERAADFLRALPHRHKVVIAGNHDFGFERRPAQAVPLLAGLTYLQDSGVTVEGVKIWGSPWQPWFFDWAFNLQRGPQIRAKWDLIPAATDILLTHGPPWGHGDETVRGQKVGCHDLLAAIQRVRPKLHLFGHIHEGYGSTQEGPTRCVNASICDLAYQPKNAPVVVEW